MEDIIPASQQLIGLLGVTASESEIIEIVRKPSLVPDPVILAIREIVRWLQQIHATEAKVFYLDAHKLASEVIFIDFKRENSFFYKQVLTQECEYIVPQALNEASDIWAVLGTLVRWKQNPQFPHSAPIGVTLFLNILLRFVIANRQYRCRFDELLRIWIYTSLQTVIEEPFYFISQMAEVGNGH